MIHGPLKYGTCRWDAVRVKVFESHKRDNALGHAVDVHRILMVVKISYRPVRTEKVGAVEIEAAPNMRLEFLRLDISRNGVQRAEVEASVKVIDPSL